jgi:hypothetical protein
VGKAIATPHPSNLSKERTFKMAGNKSRGTAEDARNALIGYQKQEVIDAHKRLGNLVVPGVAGATIAGAGKYAETRSLPQVAKAILGETLGAVTNRYAAPFVPLFYGGYMLYDHANNYDLNKQNKLASQSYSRGSGMYNPYDD